MDQHGADAVRWFMAAVGSPWSARRVGHNTLQEVVRKTLLTYWNTAAFQSLYGRTAGWSPSDVRPGARPTGRCWTAGCCPSCNALVRDVDAAMDAFDTHEAGKLLVGLRRRPVQLVRAPQPPPVLARRPGGPGHAARGADARSRC